MQKFLILAQSSSSAAALEAWRGLVCGTALRTPELTPEPIIHDPNASTAEQGVLAYHTLVNRIAAASGLNEDYPNSEAVVVMVDAVRPTRMSAIADTATWDHLVAMLILTFPEIRWAFGIVVGNEAGGLEGFPKDDHDFLSLLIKPRRSPLLDPTGLREWVRNVTNNELATTNSDDQQSLQESTKRDKKPSIPRRRLMAAAIDEENEYAHMHAYAAYRYGFRADIVTSWRLMEHLFAEREPPRESHGYALLFEDMRLRFPDKPNNIHLSELEPETNEGTKTGRAFHCPLLRSERDKSLWRVLITTGQMGADDYIVDDAHYHLERKALGRGDVLYKPLGGIADLWGKAGLYKALNKGRRSGNATGFDCPPLPVGHVDLNAESARDGHGAPGKLGLIATTLIKRATSVQKAANSVIEFIQGAVIAADAVELLGGKTPTLTLLALSLKNECEVKAECAFLGAGYHLGLKTRFTELTEDVESIKHWFHEDVKERAATNARVGIMTRLVLAFRDSGLLEEEYTCLIELRRLNRKLNKPTNLNPLAWMEHGILWYGERILSSFSVLIIMTSISLAALAGLAWLISQHIGLEPFTCSSAVSQVFGWFFGGNAYDKHWLLGLLSWCTVLIGVFHIGVLISYLYSLISRR